MTVCVCACVWVCMCMCTCMCACTRVCMCMRVCMCVGDLAGMFSVLSPLPAPQISLTRMQTVHPGVRAPPADSFPQWPGQREVTQPLPCPRCCPPNPQRLPWQLPCGGGAEGRTTAIRKGRSQGAGTVGMGGTQFPLLPPPLSFPLPNLSPAFSFPLSLPPSALLSPCLFLAAAMEASQSLLCSAGFGAPLHLGNVALQACPPHSAPPPRPLLTLETTEGGECEPLLRPGRGLRDWEMSPLPRISRVWVPAAETDPLTP